MSGEGKVPAGVGLAYDNAAAKLQRQRADIDGLDTKAAAILGLVAIALGAYAQFASHPVSTRVGGVLLGAAALASFFAIRIRDYADAPPARTFATYAGHQPDRMKELFLPALLDAIDANKRAMDGKRRALNLALTLLAFLALLTALGHVLGVQ